MERWSEILKSEMPLLFNSPATIKIEAKEGKFIHFFEDRYK